MAKEASPKRIIKRTASSRVVSKQSVTKKSRAVRKVNQTQSKVKVTLKPRRTSAKPGSSPKAKDTEPIISPITPSSLIRDRILAKVREETKTKRIENEDTVSFVAGEPAVRLREKVAIYRRIVNEKGPEIMSKVAQISGYTFIFFGLVFLYAQALVLPSGTLKQVATALCVSEDCSTTNLPVDDTQAVVLPPKVTFLSVPAQVTEQTMISLQLENVNDHSLTLISRSNGREYEITTKRNSSDGRADYLLRPDSVPSGVYTVRVSVIGLSGAVVSVLANSLIEFPLTNKNDQATANTTPDETRTDLESISAEVDLNETHLSRPESDKTELNHSEPRSTDMTNPVILTPDNPRLAIKQESDTLYQVLLAGISTDEPLAIYATLVQSMTPQFLGMMYRGSGQYIYWLDSNNLPSGRYELSVTRRSNPNSPIAKVAFSHLRTATTSLPVTEAPLPKVTPTTDSGRSPVAKEVTEVVSVGFRTANDELVVPAEPLDRTADRKARELLEREALVYTELITRYAQALETSNPELRRLARRELDAKIRATVRESTSVTSDVTAADLERQLRARIERVTEQVGRLDRIADVSDPRRFMDSDSDGISDYDEIHLYGTDPYNPDTDGDGILDGVEIMLGFDPLDPNPEAIITFESPRDVSYVSETKLGIWSVEPLVEYTEDMAVASVQAVIRGFGLPNSFVTLYIFSTPTIVTVRTGDDGSFEYIFSRELEDGKHEVYVAITDNTGAIVARSNPFAFVKTAQAFTYADEASANTSFNVIPSERESVVSYYLVAAMGVVSFGIILLLLSHSLRRREEPVVAA